MALSGCLGGDDKPQPTGDTADLRGSIEGRVLDGAGLPLWGATVRALLVNQSTRADADGLFRLDDVPVGPVRLVASAENHVSQAKDVEVAVGQIAVVDFQLEDLGGFEPYHRIVPFSGTVACSLAQAGGCGAAVPNSNNTHRFAVEAGLEAIIVELQWQPSLGGTGERLRAELRAANATACGLPYADAASGSPLRLETRQGFPLHGGQQCLYVTAPQDVTAVNQAYDAWVSLFYYAPPPADFTAAPV